MVVASSGEYDNCSSKTHNGRSFVFVELLWRRVGLRHTLKKSSAQVQTSHLEIKISLAGWLRRQGTYPEKNCAHWTHVIERRTWRSGGLFSSRASRRGTRLRRKYGAHILKPWWERSFPGKWSGIGFPRISSKIVSLALVGANRPK